jgi:hypothetical protein
MQRMDTVSFHLALSSKTSPASVLFQLYQHLLQCWHFAGRVSVWALIATKCLDLLLLHCLFRFHPCRESERVRIERNNPNPKLPMVRYVGGTWRVGGLLALSRAFGDAYLKVGLGVCGSNFRVDSVV